MAAVIQSRFDSQGGRLLARGGAQGLGYCLLSAEGRILHLQEEMEDKGVCALGEAFCYSPRT